ncbi:GMC oxidoreductase [Alteromonas mediterranea]|uniref:GMC oxidoreductase n=1 Tax=Alteromonas mediterranea TaxID=314275 RepID=UPI0012F761C1|nr:GMC family oxidoreductase [Alteromonas mediterranea]QGX63104.1 GMC family oxidoreductase [Alteromonas mediterranea]
MNNDYDVIIVGSGITGGWAAKEFCERGFNTLVIERGRNVDHRGPEYKDFQAPWDLQNRGMPEETLAENGHYATLRKKGHLYKTDALHFFVDDKKHPYSSPEDKPFMWTRGYQLGGRSLTWGRQVLRWSPMDFEANAKDGHGIEWPIGYEDLAPWYSYVEKFIGVSANKDGLKTLPDGEFQTPWGMSYAEQYISNNIAKKYTDRHLIIGRAANLTSPTEEQTALGRGKCLARSYCRRGCSFGAYFSSQSATLPAAHKTGNLTVITDSIVERIDYDDVNNKVSGVSVIDANTKERRQYKSRAVFMCASALGTVQVMLNSTSKTFPNGIANSSGMLGHYILGHVTGVVASADVPVSEDKYAFGRRPIATYIPNYRHEKQDDANFVRGFGFQTTAQNRSFSSPNAKEKGIGIIAKQSVGKPGPWRFRAFMYGEVLPYYENVASLHPTQKDEWGMPLLHIDAEIKDNERKMIKQAAKDIQEILEVGGCTNIQVKATPENKHIPMGKQVHEMGGACMGKNPDSSVLNGWGQTHDIPNLFVTDGACMASSATQNPSLTYMAITARAADYAAKLLKNNII